jgi:CTP:molybdopterin cytidylyltransferase MocA
MVKPRAVILAAGESRRMGRTKLLLDLNGKPLLRYAIDAARGFDPIVVTSEEIANARWLQEAGVEIALNDRPDLGMAHSLKIAHEHTDLNRGFLVLLGDKPFVTPQLIARVYEAARDAEVCYPVRGREPGHPVYFSPIARTRIPSLPEGGILCGLRDDPSLNRNTFECDDDAAFFDIDTPEDMKRAAVE